MTLDALHGTDVAFDARIHAARPHPGQIRVATNLRRLIELDKPALRVTYKLQEVGEPTLEHVLVEKGLLQAALV